jgi:hypothetical protein
MTILYKAEQSNKSVLLHCHAGKNRSQTVADCYYYMRSKIHRDRQFKNNRLIENCANGHLPSLRQIEKFLTKLDWLLNNNEVIVKSAFIRCFPHSPEK